MPSPSPRLRLRPTVDTDMVDTAVVMAVMEDMAALTEAMVDTTTARGPLMPSPRLMELTAGLMEDMADTAALMAVMVVIAVDMVDTDITDEHSSKVHKQSDPFSRMYRKKKITSSSRKKTHFITIHSVLLFLL